MVRRGSEILAQAALLFPVSLLSPSGNEVEDSELKVAVLVSVTVAALLLLMPFCPIWWLLRAVGFLPSNETVEFAVMVFTLTVFLRTSFRAFLWRFDSLLRL
eukprot:gb/GEZN01010145.1/.p1 GENE.gb/GEZN01010145.1/~~gb/GEZN01010145.1/.p1  ORF type:complete len:102 (+),score=12.27 gb/GEZN01010145.1/:455-760(+)